MTGHNTMSERKTKSTVNERKKNEDFSMKTIF